MQRAGRVYSATMRETQRKLYTDKFNAILMREGGNITYYKYYDKKNNVYYIHIKIPSETINDFYYDVVLKFYANSKVKDLGRDLSKYYVKFYSNDPSFVFTYAYVFNRAGLFVDELLSKMSKKAIRDAAKVTNPENQVGYVKSIYFAYLFMKNRNLFNISLWGDAIDYDKNRLLANVENADDKVTKRLQEGNSIIKKKTREEEISNNKIQKHESKKSIIDKVKTVAGVKKSNIIKAIKPNKKNNKK